MIRPTGVEGVVSEVLLEDPLPHALKNSAAKQIVDLYTLISISSYQLSTKAFPMLKASSALILLIHRLAAHDHKFRFVGVLLQHFDGLVQARPSLRLITVGDQLALL